MAGRLKVLRESDSCRFAPVRATGATRCYRSARHPACDAGSCVAWSSPAQRPTSNYTTSQAVERYISTGTGLWPDEEHLIREFFSPPPASILDLGVGTGRTTVPLHEMGYDVVGIEYSEDMVKFAAEKYPEVRIQQGDARAVNFPDESFDGALFSFNGLDYMYPYRDRLQVLRETLRMLRPGAIFLMSSHNAMGCIGRLLRPPKMTARAVLFWLNQLRGPGYMREGYYHWRDAAMGIALTYSARPAVQQRQLAEAGWEVLAVRSAERPTQPPRTLHDCHVQYVCRKPAQGSTGSEAC